MHPLRRWRLKNGLTLEQVAARVGVSSPMLSMVESGDRRPSYELCERLTRVTSIAIARFMRWPITPRRAA